MRKDRSTLALLFFTMLIVNTGFGVIMPILPYYAQNLGASATTLGLLSATFAILQFLFAPIWGRLSDRIGRKPVLLIGLTGFSLSFLILGLSTQLWMLFAARMVSGMLSSAALPTVLAYIADTTPPDERAGGMGLLGAAGGIGMILGPALGGFLSALSPNAPFFFSAGLALVIAIFALAFMPETLSAEMRRLNQARPKAGNRLAVLAGALSGPLAFLMVLATLTSFGMAQLEATGALFAKARFNAGGTEMGMLFMLMGLVGVLAQFLLVSRLIRWVGERRAIQISLLGTGVSFIGFGIVRTQYEAVAAVILMGLATSFLRPALNTLVSKSAAASEQGMTMGVVNSFYSLGMMFGPVTGGIIFDHLGLAWPFYSAGGIQLLALLASLFLFRQQAAPAPLSSELE